MTLEIGLEVKQKLAYMFFSQTESTNFNVGYYKIYNSNEITLDGDEILPLLRGRKDALYK